MCAFIKDYVKPVITVAFLSLCWWNRNSGQGGSVCVRTSFCLFFYLYRLWKEWSNFNFLFQVLFPDHCSDVHSRPAAFTVVSGFNSVSPLYEMFPDSHTKDGRGPFIHDPYPNTLKYRWSFGCRSMRCVTPTCITLVSQSTERWSQVRPTLIEEGLRDSRKCRSRCEILLRTVL